MPICFWKDTQASIDRSRAAMTVDFVTIETHKEARAELAAANKAIVALSEALEFMLMATGEIPNHTAKSALQTHAPAIEKARGG